MQTTLTLLLLNGVYFFIILKLEMVTQFPASEEFKIILFVKLYIFQIELFDWLSIYKKINYTF